MRAWIATLAGLAGLSSGCSSSGPERSPTAKQPAAAAGEPQKPAQGQPHQPAPDKAAAGKPKPDPDKPSGGEIVTAEVLKMNGAEFGRPASKFRPGSVSAVPAPKSSKTATGFQVQFASHATITTPTEIGRAHV